ncbi:MAG: type I pullulanase [Planctomycetes bacterium]|nr:type I pullulanase [Planctomycetota bacterium]
MDCAQNFLRRAALTARHAVAAVAVALLAAIVPDANAQTQATRVPPNPRNYGTDRIVVLHYARLDGDYDGWNAWAWPEGKDGAAFRFDGGDAFGRFAVIPLPKGEKVARVGFIVRKGDWERKDFDGDRFIEVGTRPVTEAWVVSGDGTVHAKAPVVDRSVKVVGAFLDARDRVTLATSVPLDDAMRRQLKVTLAGGGLPVRAKSVRASKGGTGAAMADIGLSRDLDDDEIAKLRIELPGQPAATVFAREVLNDPAFVASDATLGVTCTPFKATFSTWSPVSDSVEALIFDGPAAREPSRTVALRRGANGTWSAEVPGDLHGKPYLYRFTSYGQQRVTPDIHCFAATHDSGRSVAVDLSRVQPDGWSDAPLPTIARATDEVLYELHVRDYSVADESCPPARRGSYLGLVHEGRSPTGSPTGLAYLKALGITAVHLLPVHDYGGTPDAYNWGYWTQFFNVPESNYATDRGDALSPIRDLRTAIMGLHAARIRVILDVVYNHTCSSRESSPFDQTVPYWFFRTSPDGAYSNDAGCGNSVADERPMVRKYILDSLAFWLENYKVDGFRFDLLATHAPETVRAACALVKRLRPDATLYGEPWTGGGPIRFGKGAQKGLPIAVFNDHVRGALRGDTDGSSSGFATGPGGDAGAVRRGAAGSIDDFAQEPTETINYVSAHDNLTLVDKIAKAAPQADARTRRAMQKLALGAVLCFQGVPFIEGGSEICRTKGGNHNSYDAGDAVNRFDWTAAGQCAEVRDWVAGMIAIRREHPALRMADDADVRKAVEFLQTDGAVVAWTIDGTVAKDPARRVLVVLNGEASERKVMLPSGQWSVLADDDDAGTAPQGKLTGSVTLPAYSLLVAVQ